MLSRVPARLMLAAGLLLTGIGLLLMGGVSAEARVDDSARRLPGRRRRGRTAQPGDRRRRRLASCPRTQSGMASGINDTFRQVGVAVGIAAWGAIFVGRGDTR